MLNLVFEHELVKIWRNVQHKKCLLVCFHGVRKFSGNENKWKIGFKLEKWNLVEKCINKEHNRLSVCILISSAYRKRPSRV